MLLLLLLVCCETSRSPRLARQQLANNNEHAIIVDKSLARRLFLQFSPVAVNSGGGGDGFLEQRFKQSFVLLYGCDLA